MDTFIGLKVDEIKHVSQSMGLKEKHLVPFAKDCDDSLLCLQLLENGQEKVVTIDSD